jgi:hypothetical protein
MPHLRAFGHTPQHVLLVTAFTGSDRVKDLPVNSYIVVGFWTHCHFLQLTSLLSSTRHHIISYREAAGSLGVTFISITCELVPRSVLGQGFVIAL